LIVRNVEDQGHRASTGQYLLAALRSEPQEKHYLTVESGDVVAGSLPSELSSQSELFKLAALLIVVGALSRFLAGLFDIGGGAILFPYRQAPVTFLTSVANNLPSLFAELEAVSDHDRCRWSASATRTMHDARAHAPTITFRGHQVR
jgi:hypothetical protein